LHKEFRASFWAHSKNQCTLKNDEKDKDFDEAALTRAVARVVVGVFSSISPMKGIAARYREQRCGCP